MVKSIIFIQMMMAGALCTTISTANASQTAENFQSNCDIRKIALSPEQRAQLRVIRDEYRRNMNQALHKVANNSQYQRDLFHILSDRNFNYEAARNYINNRSVANMDIEMAELKSQQQMYQMLTPRQRQQWINSCF